VFVLAELSTYNLIFPPFLSVCASGCLCGRELSLNVLFHCLRAHLNQLSTRMPLRASPISSAGPPLLFFTIFSKCHVFPTKVQGAGKFTTSAEKYAPRLHKGVRSTPSFEGCRGLELPGKLCGHLYFFLKMTCELKLEF
jgi:hypothetical protein